MPQSKCPQCQFAPPQWLPETSKDAVVNYYRCEACGHVWHVRKSHPDGPTTSVTDSMPMPEARSESGRVPD